MNFSVHLFGFNEDRSIQYPSDGNADILQQCAKITKNGATLTIHRSGPLIHYIYAYDISGKEIAQRVMGVSITFNGVYINDLQTLSKTFETILYQIVMGGKLLKVNKEGLITFNFKDFLERRHEVEQIEAYIKTTIEESLCPYFVRFRQNFSGQVGIKTLPLKTDSKTILDTVERFDVVRLYTDENQEVGYISKMISQLNDENRKLRKELQKLSRKKKQFKNVVFLLLVVIGCGIGIYFLNDNLNETQSKLDDANTTIVKKEETIKNKDAEIDELENNNKTLTDSYVSEKSKREDAENKLQSISGTFPFFITSCSVSSDKFSFDYYSFEEKEITVTLKAVNDRNSEVVSNSHTETFYKGSGHKELYFYYSLNTSQYYYVVLMYDGKIIGGKRW